MPRIYTKTGDKGTTGLWRGQRVDKDAARVQAYGTTDECNAAIGVARASGMEAPLDELLAEVQGQLFVLGSDLTAPQEAPEIPRVTSEHIDFLEQAIDRLESGLEPLRQFILPGGSLAGAHLHLARTICRRAERWVVSLSHTEPVNPAVVVYLNRLSDLLFVAARSANSQAGVSDVAWNSPRRRRG
jgi:cob(I)alamin adenosyltransferase